jgi:hypothetical protein
MMSTVGARVTGGPIPRRRLSCHAQGNGRRRSPSSAPEPVQGGKQARLMQCMNPEWHVSDATLLAPKVQYGFGFARCSPPRRMAAFGAFLSFRRGRATASAAHDS